MVITNLFVGIALMSMCIQLVQENVKEKVKIMASKLGTGRSTKLKSTKNFEVNDSEPDSAEEAIQISEAPKESSMDIEELEQKLDES